jgi:hypothetical protein
VQKRVHLLQGFLHVLDVRGGSAGQHRAWAQIAAQDHDLGGVAEGKDLARRATAVIPAAICCRARAGAGGHSRGQGRTATLCRLPVRGGGRSALPLPRLAAGEEGLGGDLGHLAAGGLGRPAEVGAALRVARLARPPRA